MIIAFVGDNNQAKQQAVRTLIDDFIGVYGNMAVDRLDGESLDLAHFKDAVLTTPLLVEHRLVVVRDLSINKLIVDKLPTIIKNIPASTDLVIIENHSDNRDKYFKNLKTMAEIRQFDYLEGTTLLHWIIDQTMAIGGTIDTLTAQFLIDRVGTNQQMLFSELAKLVLYHPKVTNQAIQLLSSFNPQSSIFAMLDAAFNGNTALALKLYNEQRVQGMEPRYILGMVVWQLHILGLIKVAGKMPLDSLAAKSKLNSYVVRKNLLNAHRISESKYVHLLSQAILADKRMKTSSTNDDDILLALIMSF